MGNPEKLKPRKKPLRRSAHGLKSKPLVIDENSGPVRIEGEQKDGRCVVKITSLCPPDCQCGGAHCETCLTPNS